MTTAHIDNIAQEFNKDLTASNVKTAMSSIDAKKRDMYFVPVDSLSIMDDFNVRAKNDNYNQAVREIADSIKANGFYPHKPFAVLVIKENGKDVLAIYDGHTRFDGLKLAISEGAAIERVPVVCAPQGTSIEDITVGLVTNNSGRQLEPLAIAIVVKRLVGYGLSNDEIAKRLGFTIGYISSLLILVGAPKKIRDLVSDGKVSASLAVITIRDHSENAVSVLEAGLIEAVAAGKTKVTAKNIPVPAAKNAKKNLPAPVLVPRKPTVIELGLAWLIQNGGGDERDFSFFSAVTGLTVEELKVIRG